MQPVTTQPSAWRAAEIMEPEPTLTYQIKIDVGIKELEQSPPNPVAHRSSSEAGKANPLNGARPTMGISKPTPPALRETVDKMATMSDQTPVSLLGALATGANELEPVGLFPWPFKSPDVEYVFQAQFVSAASCLCLCSPVFLSSAYLSPPLCSDNLPLRLGLCVRTQCHKSKYFNTRYL